ELRAAVRRDVRPHDASAGWPPVVTEPTPGGAGVAPPGDAANRTQAGRRNRDGEKTGDRRTHRAGGARRAGRRLICASERGPGHSFRLVGPAVHAGALEPRALCSERRRQPLLVRRYVLRLHRRRLVRRSPGRGAVDRGQARLRPAAHPCGADALLSRPAARVGALAARWTATLGVTLRQALGRPALRARILSGRPSRILSRRASRLLPGRASRLASDRIPGRAPRRPPRRVPRRAARIPRRAGPGVSGRAARRAP